MTKVQKANSCELLSKVSYLCTQQQRTGDNLLRDMVVNCFQKFHIFAPSNNQSCQYHDHR